MQDDAHRIMAFPHEASIKRQAWEPLQASPKLVQQICQRTGFSSLLAEIIANRIDDLDDVDAFLNPSLKKHLPSFNRLPDISKAATLIKEAITKKQTIALWGDYDVDGATSVALWFRFFKSVGITPHIYIPDRFKEGYGPNTEGIKKLEKKGVSLLITLDCGTVSFEPLAYAKKCGMQVVIVDHHNSADTLPEADAIVNPKRKDAPKEAMPMAILAAVGVSFFCVIAVHKKLQEAGFYKTVNPLDLRLLLDLVALGTVCDMVPLLGVNRLLTQKGLLVMQKCLNTGIEALRAVNNHTKSLTATDMGFLFGPQLNAGGRLADTRLASQLLSTTNTQEATAIAQELQSLNTTRKSIQKAIEAEGLLEASKQASQPFILVHDASWHEGVIGIVASRLKDAMHKPTFVLSFKNNIGKGSARSLPGCDIGALLHEATAQKILLKGGGHAMAGGLTMEKEKLEAFKTFCAHFIQKTPITQPTQQFCGVLSLSSLTDALWLALSKLAPFGAGNTTPCFLFQNVTIQKVHTFGGGHVRLTLQQQGTHTADALIFSAHQTPFYALIKQHKHQPFHCVSTIEKNAFNNKLQLFIKDIILEAPAAKTA